MKILALLLSLSLFQRISVFTGLSITLLLTGVSIPPAGWAVIGHVAITLGLLGLYFAVGVGLYEATRAAVEHLRMFRVKDESPKD
jgi:hypothetical protein